MQSIHDPCSSQRQKHEVEGGHVPVRLYVPEWFDERAEVGYQEEGGDCNDKKPECLPFILPSPKRDGAGYGQSYYQDPAEGDSEIGLDGH